MNHTPPIMKTFKTSMGLPKGGAICIPNWKAEQAKKGPKDSPYGQGAICIKKPQTK